MKTPPGKLPTSRAFLDRLARKLGDPKDPRKPASDYRVAKVLGIDGGTISRIRNRKQTFGEELALKVAAELGEPEPYLLACVYYERERSVRVRVVWEAIARAAAIGAVVVVSSAVQALGLDCPAPASTSPGYTLCVSRRARRRTGRVLARVHRHRRRRPPQHEIVLRAPLGSSR